MIVLVSNRTEVTEVIRKEAKTEAIQTRATQIEAIQTELIPIEVMGTGAGFNKEGAHRDILLSVIRE